MLSQTHAYSLSSNSLKNCLRWILPSVSVFHVRRLMHVGLPCNSYSISLVALCSKHSHLTSWRCIPISSRLTVDLLDFFKTRVQSSLQSHSVTSDFITQDIQGYAVWLSPDNTDKSTRSFSVSQTHCLKIHTYTHDTRSGRLPCASVYTHAHTHTYMHNENQTLNSEQTIPPLG